MAINKLRAWVNGEEIEITLDKECWSCGDDSHPVVEVNGVCQICKGSDWELTGAGEAILDLVKRHIFRAQREVPWTPMALGPHSQDGKKREEGK